jgi:phage-related baseplate assembly protein
MKVLKDALKSMNEQHEKLKDENQKLLMQIQKLKTDNEMKEQQHNKIFEENHKLHDQLLQLQQKMVDEMGLSLETTKSTSAGEDDDRKKSSKRQREDHAFANTQLEFDEQAMIDQMNASNAVAAALVEKERELETLMQSLKERDLMIDESNTVIESLN